MDKIKAHATECVALVKKRRSPLPIRPKDQKRKPATRGGGVIFVTATCRPPANPHPHPDCDWPEEAETNHSASVSHVVRMDEPRPLLFEPVQKAIWLS
jgi:hypothetical protein